MSGSPKTPDGARGATRPTSQADFDRGASVTDLAPSLLFAARPFCRSAPDRRSALRRHRF